MSMILNKSIPMFMKGYPTMGDKYDVLPGQLEGTTPVAFGELVAYGSATGYYKAITDTVTLADIAGICLATNVKLANEWPAKTITANPKEAFNLLTAGYVAIELDSDAVEASIKPGAKVAVKLATGKFTTSGVSEATDLPGYTFTGLIEKKGTAIFAEILVK